MVRVGLLVVAALAVLPVQAAVARPRPPADPNAIRCKKLAVTGSLVRTERICKTNAEWRKIMDQQGRDADDLVTRSRAGMDCRFNGSC